MYYTHIQSTQTFNQKMFPLFIASHCSTIKSTSKLLITNYKNSYKVITYKNKCNIAIFINIFLNMSAAYALLHMHNIKERYITIMKIYQQVSKQR